MDPFVEMQYYSDASKDKLAKVKTTAIREGGKLPVWNETLTIPVSQKMLDDQNLQELKVTCYDEDVIVHDKVGTAIFKIAEFLKFSHPTPVKLILKHNKERAAEI